MAGQPHWMDKWITKASWGVISRSPGTERTKEDDFMRDEGPRKPLSRWTRRHGLPVFLVLMFVLPTIMAIVSGDFDRLLRLALIFGPSLLIAIILTSF